MKRVCWLLSVVMLVAVAVTQGGCAGLSYQQADREHDTFLLARDATLLAWDAGKGPVSLADLDKAKPYLATIYAALESTDEAALDATVKAFVEAQVESSAGDVDRIVIADVLGIVLDDVHFTDQAVLHTQSVTDARNVVGGILSAITMADNWAATHPSAATARSGTK